MGIPVVVMYRTFGLLTMLNTLVPCLMAACFTLTDLSYVNDGHSHYTLTSAYLKTTTPVRHYNIRDSVDISIVAGAYDPIEY